MRAWLSSCPGGHFLFINNAGLGSIGPFASTDPARSQNILDVNIRAAVTLTHALLPVLQTRGGGMIHLASLAAHQPLPGMAVYAASKAFLLHWALALRRELRPSGLRVLTVCPGPVRTEFGRVLGLPKAPAEPGPDADAVALDLLEAYARDRATIHPGWRARLLGAFASILPPTWTPPVSAHLVARFLRRHGGRSMAVR